MKDEASNLLEPGEDITGRSCILSTHAASTKLTSRLQKVDIVGSNKVLGHSNNGSCQGSLTVMVCRVFRDVTSQLSHLDFLLELALEARKQDLALRRLEAIHHVWNRTLVVCLRKEDQLLIDKVGVIDHPTLCLGVVEESVRFKIVEPRLTILDTTLVEAHVNQIGARDLFIRNWLGEIKVIHVHIFLLGNGFCVFGHLSETYFVDLQVGEVVLGFSSSRCTQTLIVLDLESLAFIPGRILPHFVLRQGEEGSTLLALGRLDNRSDELLQKVWNIQQTRPVVMQDVDYQTLDMGSIVILIGHNHEVTVTKSLDVVLGVNRTKLESQDIHHILNFFVLDHLRLRCLAHIEGLSLEWEDSIVITSDDTKTRHSE
mmetsp:Transcript_21683/g.35834  ORF Transcript_21683/g.35834 Transcript_21683/m.35834 type:complete len:372 (+) Transcript_21683:2019-3134(+)